MDNDKQIIKNPVNLFLKEQVYNDKDRENLYDLEDEFEKTKKNKNVFLKIIVFLFIFSLVAFAFVFSRFIEDKNKNTSVNISAFEDVNLRDLLDTAKKNENKLNVAKNERQELINRLNQKKNDVQNDTSKKIEIISTQTMSDEEKIRKIAAARRVERNLIENADIEFSEKISLKNKEIADLQKIVDDYDQRQMDFAKRNEEVLNNQTKVFEIEKNKLVSSYEEKIKVLNSRLKNETGKLKSHYGNVIAILKENYRRDVESLVLKYNPLISDEDFVTATRADISSDLVDLFELNGYDAVLNYENITTKKQFDVLRQYIANRNTIMERLLQIPYVNSIPVALYKNEFYSEKIIQTYENMWKKLLENVKKKNIDISNLNDEIGFKTREIEEISANLKKIEESLSGKEAIISKYNKSFDLAIKSRGDYGLIIDAGDQKNVDIYIPSDSNIMNGIIVTILRDKNDNIGKIMLKKEGDRMKGEIISLQKGKTLSPMDRIASK